MLSSLFSHIFHRKFSHPNIVQFMGIYVNEQEEQYLVTEVRLQVSQNS